MNPARDAGVLKGIWVQFLYNMQIKNVLRNVNAKAISTTTDCLFSADHNRPRPNGPFRN